MTEHELIACMIAVVSMLAVSGARAEEPNAQDKQFIKDAGSGGMLEVRLGQYAATNAASGDVKKFGEHMAGDHSKANDDLHGLATQQPLEIPKTLNDEDKQVLERLEKLRGAEFDKAYITQMVEDHQKDIAAFEKEITDGSDSLVKAFAERTLPVLQHHLKMAQDLEKRDGK